MEICGDCPDRGSWRREISEYMASDVTASWMRAPPESLMPMTGQPTLVARSIRSQTFLPKVMPTEPPYTDLSWAYTATGRPPMRAVPVTTPSP